MKIAITGSSGLVGSALQPALRGLGHELLRLVRGPGEAADAAAWNPTTGAIDAGRCAGLDAVVHLAGENVAGGRWTDRRMAAIRDSRGPATERLCRSLAALPQPPRILIGASAVGIYGDRGDELLDEQSAAGKGFLAEVAAEWEAATAPLEAVGARVVHLRIGMVLAKHGGALRKMLPAFRLGGGGRLGHGNQWMSWITLDDLVGAVLHCLDCDDLRGPVLAVAPDPATNRQFTRALAGVLRRPAILPVPAFALRLVFGRMADPMLLASQRAMPRQLLASGFRFAHEELVTGLQAALRA